MFKSLREIFTTEMSGKTLEDYYQSRRLIDVYFADMEQKNCPFRESRRPNGSCVDFDTYKECIIERFEDRFGEESFRVLMPSNPTKGKFGEVSSMFDCGLEFDRKGDAFNYIDEGC